MTRMDLKALWWRKRRVRGVASAVFLGIAFLTGTQVLADTVDSSITGSISNADSGTDAVVRNATDVSNSPGTRRAPIPASVLASVRATPGVADAVPVIDGYGQIVGSDGKVIKQNGPRLATNWVANPALNPYRIVQGHPPRDDHEVVINRAAARSGHLSVGDRTTIDVPTPVPVVIAGIATFGSADAFGGSSYAAFTFHAAQHYLVPRPDEITSVAVKAKPGIAQTALAQRLQQSLPAGVQAISGSQLNSEALADVDKEFLDGFKVFLTAFAVIALVVAMFSIYNTYAIVAAQRARESALLRAVGATRRQLLALGVLEAAAIAVVASAAGVGAGLGLAAGLKGLFAGFGFALPASGLTLTATTVAIALSTGIVACVLAALAPAVGSSRVPPIAALRETALLRERRPRRRMTAGFAAAGVGVALVASAALTTDGSAAIAGLGVLLTMTGAILLGPAIAKPAATAIGSLAGRRRGASGILARRNAARDPQRTARAASALMIGITVVALLTVVASSLAASARSSTADVVRADLAITPGSGYSTSGFSPSLADRVRRLPQVRQVAELSTDSVKVFTDSEKVTIAQPASLTSVLALRTSSGSLRLGDRQIAVSQTVAAQKHYKLGTVVPIQFADGTTERFAVAAIYGTNAVTEDYLMTRAAWIPHAQTVLDDTVLVKLAPGQPVAPAQDAIKHAVKGYGAPAVDTRGAFIDSQTAGVSAFVGIIYVMLAMAILIALGSIANTLSLSIHERTRELGVLRAIGQSRRQLRSMIRLESVITSAVGSITGVALGIFAGCGLVEALASPYDTTRISFPAPTLVLILAICALAGVLASRRPARAAARIDVLTAVASE
ncbi:MAG: ABC transporter permease [Solirubrobacteraceae bacterium]